jgi:group I intron endonuclease
MNRNGIIYIVTNQINGKQYIGKTVGSLSRRRSQHGCRGYVFYNALKKYGKSAFTWKILCECPLDEIDAKEIFFIKKYNTCITNGGRGYNIQLGGNGAPYGDANPTKRPEVREKLRMAALGNKNPMKNPLVSNKVSRALTGKSKSQTHRKNISAGMMGHFTPKGNENWISKRFLITFPDGHEETIVGLLDYCRRMGLPYEQLRYAQKRNITSTGGYRCQLIS